MLRFRDLVTEPGGTIIEHKAILRSHGEVWWGWWKRMHEKVPRNFLANISKSIKGNTCIYSYIFDVSSQKIYLCETAKIKLSPTGGGMPSPEPEKSPEYYHRGRYSAWFLFKSIDEQPINSLKLVYESSPSYLVDSQKYKSSNEPLIMEHNTNEDNIIRTFRDLKKLDVTMWFVKEITDD